MSVKLGLPLFSLQAHYKVGGGNTVYIGFYDQPPSQGSRSLNPMEVAKSRGFSPGIATRWSLKPT